MSFLYVTPRKCFCLSSFALVDFPLSLRLHRPFSEELSRPEAHNTEMLKQEVEENVSRPLAHVHVVVYSVTASSLS